MHNACDHLTSAAVYVPPASLVGWTVLAMLKYININQKMTNVLKHLSLPSEMYLLDDSYEKLMNILVT